MDPLDHPDVAAARLERAPAPRDPEQVAIGGYDAVLVDKFQCCIDFPLGGDTDRASGSHDNLQPLGKHAADPVPGDGGLVGPADMHERHVPVHEIMDFLGDLLSYCHL